MTIARRFNAGASTVQTELVPKERLKTLARTDTDMLPNGVWFGLRASSFVIRNSFNYASFPPVLRAKTHVTKAGHFPEMRYNASSWYANNCARFPAAKNPGGG
jgi:hypothetical protein